MPGGNHTLIRVHREWDGWRTAEIRLHDLRNVHWSQPHRAHRPLVHGFVCCGDLVSGDFPHDCDATPGPHQLLVCVLKRHTAASVYLELARQARASIPYSEEETRSA